MSKQDQPDLFSSSRPVPAAPINTNIAGKPSRAAQQASRLIVESSTVIVTGDGEIEVRCSVCQRVLPFRAFGVENLPEGKGMRAHKACRGCR